VYTVWEKKAPKKGKKNRYIKFEKKADGASRLKNTKK